MSKNWTKIRAKVKDFIESEIYPKETELAKGTPCLLYTSPSPRDPM